MTSRDFCFWLQGYLELRANKDASLSTEQARCIASHLALVFTHDIDPSMGAPAHQTKLNEIHSAQSNQVAETNHLTIGGSGPTMRC